MNEAETAMAQQIAQVAIAHQKKQTGHAPASVSVVLNEETLVITLHDALTLAEKALAMSAEGAAQVQEFHRQLFLSSAASLRLEIKRITGREVREAAAGVEPASGTVVHAFTTGNVVQVHRLSEIDQAKTAGLSDPLGSV
ncbi:MAG: Na-translocating system protein MpsC family protein [Bythopirellula sp.]|nr:Na-translocating system protein MpsC family protein [Bythopirellula sp.]